MITLSGVRMIQWRMISHRICRILGVLLLLTFMAWMLLLFFPKKDLHLSLTHDFGIGFDLSPSYATVAVSHPDGSIQPIARVGGDKEYKEMMLRYSLRSSEHLHPPYQNVGEAIQDGPRRTQRNTRKKLGLPASKDVGTLSKMVQALRDKAEDFVGQPISAASISVPHLTALYGEDLYDTFEYLSLVHLEFFPFYNFRPIHSTIAAYAGNGLGLCADYTDIPSCEKEELDIPSLFALAITYTYSSLTASQAHVSNAYYLEETPTFEDLRLGYDARHDNLDEDFYWEEVRDMLRFPIATSPIQRNISMVLVSGDAAEIPKFREVLESVIYETIDGEPEVIDYDPLYAAAKGVAEMAKRAIFRQREEMNMVSEL